MSSAAGSSAAGSSAAGSPSSSAAGQPVPLAGQSALVTGGGSGIGLACATALARDGAAVTLAGRSGERLRTGAEQLAAEVPSADVATAVCDVTSEADVGAACTMAADQGRLSILVASAGLGSGSPFHLTPLEEWRSVLDTNLTGAFLAMREVVPHMAAVGGGSIVAVSSIAGVSTHRYMAAYAVSKAGLEMLVRNVADELGPVGIRANAVRPGLVPTDISAGLVAHDQITSDYVAQMPLGRLGTTDDVAALVRFLAGAESSWITGTCISVDGGHHLRRGPNLDGMMAAALGDARRPAGPDAPPA